jgi:predicted dienelactone hydrolase
VIGLFLAQLAIAGSPALHSQTAEMKRTGASPLPVRAIWPDGEGPFPVIVFSHGLHLNRDGYKPRVEHWARNGFLVLLPTHDDRVNVAWIRV